MKSILRKIQMFTSKKVGRLHTKIMKIQIVKALLGLITIILSYKIVKYFILFNKLIIYLFGLLFVGVNWSDYHFFKEMKLIYDSLVLFFLSYFPDNSTVNEMKDSTRNDIKDIINYKDHTNVNGKIEDDYVYVIADKIPEIKSIRSDLKETMISDGNDQTWSLSDVFSHPLIIFTIVSAIFVTGTIVVYHYDLTLDQITTYTYTNLKMGFVATISFLGKVIRFFTRSDPRPPIEPNHPDLPNNPALNLDKGKNVLDESKTPTLRPTFLRSHPNKPEYVFGPDRPPFFDAIQSNPILSQNQVVLNKIVEANATIKDLMELPDTKDKFRKIKFLKVKIEELQGKFIDLDTSPTGSITPTGSKSPINTDGLNLPNILDD